MGPQHSTTHRREIMAISPKLFKPEALKAPQHLHVQVCCYESWDAEHNGPKGKHCDVTVIANDVDLAIHEGKKLAALPDGHQATVIQCSEKSHLEGIDLE